MKLYTNLIGCPNLLPFANVELFINEIIIRWIYHERNATIA